MHRSDVEQFLDQHRVERVRIEGVQSDGLPIGKILHPARFLDALEAGVGFVDYTWGTDRVGNPALGFSAPWRSTVVGDVYLIPDTTTLRVLPGAAGTATCLCDAVGSDGVAISMCGRGAVRRMVEVLADRGFEAMFAFEVEGQFFHGTPGEHRASNWSGLRPFGTGGHLPYLVQDLHRLDPLLSEVCRRLDGLGVPWEAWNAEAAGGQFEVNISPSDPLQAADHVLRVRQVCKEVAHEQGVSVTFMARVTEDYNNGLHVHHSLRANGEPVLYDAAEEDRLSAVAHRWLGGLMSTVTGVASFMAPTPNSFRRVEPFKAVPTHATWDIDNKSAALRVLSASPDSARIEHRMGAGDLHPYMVVAAILAGGVAGLDERLVVPSKFTKMAWGLPDGDDQPHRLPTSVIAACEALDSDLRLRAVLGDELVDYWIGLRRFEWITFHTSGGDITSVGPTPWELDRYFETL
ncbi:MAG: glutamine synthetase [Actinomycetia bacterium]|nr:glutamine synthetase [Actinomycetes bacterium]